MVALVLVLVLVLFVVVVLLLLFCIVLLLVLVTAVLFGFVLCVTVGPPTGRVATAASRASASNLLRPL